MKFTKMHGCGNDYIYINCFEEQVDNPEALSAKVSDRHFGIGGDGIVLIRPSGCADFFMDMYNADGSRGKMCGNAIRCVGKYVHDHGMTAKKHLDIETLSGIRHLDLFDGVDGLIDRVTVDMGSPITIPEQIPVDPTLLKTVRPISEVVSAPAVAVPLNVRSSDGTDFLHNFTFVSMGNPHAVCFVGDVDRLALEVEGPLYEHHRMFPERANIEFVRVIDRTHISFRVWERGSGETFACGTGACASVYASILNGFTDDEVEVHMRGGDLSIRYSRSEDLIYMTGPAVEVFSGTI